MAGSIVWLLIYKGEKKEGFPDGSAVKNLPAMQEMQEIQAQSLGLEEPLEKEVATQSSILAWEIPWMEGLAGYFSEGCKSQTRLSGSVHTTYEEKYLMPLIHVDIYEICT